MKGTQCCASFLLGMCVSHACVGSTLSAENDHNAIFDGVQFSLPELNNPKDSYTVIITVEGAKEPQVLAIPPGVTAIRLGKGATPEGNWSWSYVTKKAMPNPLTLVTPKKVELSRNEIRDDRFSVIWRPIDGAELYRVTRKSRVKEYPGDEPEWGPPQTLDCKPMHCVTRPNAATLEIPLQVGMEVEWKVSAIGEHGVVLAESEFRNIEVKTTPAQAIKKAGFKLQRSETLSKATAALPATLSRISSQKDSESRTSAYQTEIALIWDAPNPTVWDFYPRASLEARLTSSGLAKSDDALIFRYGGYKYLFQRGLEGTEFTANFKYESVHKGGTKKGLLEFTAVPIYGFLGKYWPGLPGPEELDETGNRLSLPAVRFAPIVIFGLEVGRSFDVGTSTETEDTLLRLRGNARFEVGLEALASAIGVSAVTAYADYTYWRLPREDEKSRHVRKAGLVFGLTKELSIDYSYSAGREPPNFNFVRKNILSLGVQF